MARERILLVDDDESIRQVVSLFLTDEGYTIAEERYIGTDDKVEEAAAGAPIPAEPVPAEAMTAAPAVS